MENQNILELLEEALEMDAGALSPDMKLEDLAEYDSMAKLSVIVLMDEEFGLKLTGEQIREFKNVQDIIDFTKQ